MSERVAIVAGAGGELGRATAEKLAAAGFAVAGVDRNQEALKELRLTRPTRPRPAASSIGSPPGSARRRCW
jgi:NAD(P)-dependent dehydrogenase (short-subunit alcohol dehydrogenase family)